MKTVSLALVASGMAVMLVGCQPAAESPPQASQGTMNATLSSGFTLVKLIVPNMT